MLVDRAALNRHIGPERRQRLVQAGTAVDDDEFRRLQAARDQVVQQSPPSRFALPAHVLDRQQHLLAVRTHAERHQQRDRRRLLVETHAHDRAVKNQPDDRLVGKRSGVPDVPVAFGLAPHAADGILPHRAAEQRRQGAAHPARVGPGQIGARDQGVGPFCPPLVGGNGRVPPFCRLAFGGRQPGARHANRGGAESAQNATLPMAVT